MKYGAQIIVDTLEQLGVTIVFGMPGTQNVGLYDALRSSRLRTVVSSNEMAASFAANGYYRASGKVGVLTTIPGPGFTYALSGLAEAQLDSAALLHITSTTGDGSSRKFQHQYLDMAAIAAPLVKKVITVTEIEKLADAVVEGFRLTTEGEPGPVLLLFDKSLYQQFADTAASIQLRASTSPDPTALELIAKRVSSASKLVIFAGQGCQDSPKQLKLLADATKAIVMTTNSGRGAIPESDPRSLYYDYSSGGGDTVNELIDACDLVLAIGCKFSHNGSGGFRLKIPKERFIQVDSSDGTLNSNYPASISLVALADKFLEGLLPLVKLPPESVGWDSNDIASWRSRIREEQFNRLRNVPQVMTPVPVSLEKFFAALQSTLPQDACLVTDSGFHQVLTRAFSTIQVPRGLITPADFQSMGFSIPAAIGARASSPHRTIVAIIGDGGMAISGMELLTAVREKLDLKIVVFNDGYLNLIRMQQLQGGLKESAVGLVNPDFALLASSIGANYFALTEDLSGSLAAFVNSSGVSILELFVSDGPGIDRLKLKGTLKRQVRAVVSPTMFQWLKRKIRG
ncbi:MAG: thiamine pyrophosphate-binding protein [Candidatus Zixiibacteriota bacterium]